MIAQITQDTRCPVHQADGLFYFVKGNRADKLRGEHTPLPPRDKILPLIQQAFQYFSVDRPFVGVKVARVVVRRGMRATVVVTHGVNKVQLVFHKGKVRRAFDLSHDPMNIVCSRSVIGQNIVAVCNLKVNQIETIRPAPDRPVTRTQFPVYRKRRTRKVFNQVMEFLGSHVDVNHKPGHGLLALHKGKSRPQVMHDAVVPFGIPCSLGQAPTFFDVTRATDRHRFKTCHVRRNRMLHLI